LEEQQGAKDLGAVLNEMKSNAPRTEGEPLPDKFNDAIFRFIGKNKFTRKFCSNRKRLGKDIIENDFL